VLKDGPVIDAVALGHPLISERERVCNDFSIDEQGKFIIITGANMAGKSTFLRTTGVALVLAMAGAPVCAREFRFRIMDVYTSMRTSDSLSRNESYFYAELKRLKHLVERIAGGKKVFVILDEILKGTNSVDKGEGVCSTYRKYDQVGINGYSCYSRSFTHIT
jgi:DNA mismatch repair ATPase MutS